jgi:hypothetical protein
MEKIRRILVFVIIASILLFVIYDLFTTYLGNKQYINKNYSGIISDIRVLQESRDLPDIKIKNQWIPLDLPDAKVKHYIQVGDSIIKESGSEMIKVFRKNLKDEWDIKVFK